MFSPTFRRLFLFSGILFMMVFAENVKTPPTSAAAKEAFMSLLNTVARRLDIGVDVAHFKYLKNIPITDIQSVKREHEIIRAMVVLANTIDLSEVWTTKFFESQMFANRMVQRHFFKLWKNGTHFPDRNYSTDLATIRTELDTIGRELVTQAKQSLEFRKDPLCALTIAQNIPSIGDLYNFDTEQMRLFKNYALSDVCIHNDDQ